MVDRLSFVLGMTAAILTWLFFKSELIGAFPNLLSSFEGLAKTYTFSIVGLPLLIILPALLLFKLKDEQPSTHPRWTQPITSEQFEAQARDLTQAQLQQLYKNPTFKAMLNSRGEDPRNWCWQSSAAAQVSSEEEEM
jgi:hypothetical protein